MRAPVLGVIPARLGSTRLPSKPLRTILGRPLLEWVWRRVSRMECFDALVVATDAPEVLHLCGSIGAPAVLTDPGHASGTERAAEVADLPDFREFPLIANVQGDEPLVEEAHLVRAVGLVREEGWDVGTCATPLGGEEAYRDPSVVKAVVGRGRRALYFSRAPVPWKRDGSPTEEELAGPPFLRHLGLYTYSRAALARWVALPRGTLEELERLEQLRALEGGLRIGVAIVEGAAPGVDTEEDVTRMERILSGTGTSFATEKSP